LYRKGVGVFNTVKLHAPGAMPFLNGVTNLGLVFDLAGVNPKGCWETMGDGGTKGCSVGRRGEPILLMVDCRRGELVTSGDLNGFGCFPTKNWGGTARPRAAGTGASGTGVENTLDAGVNVGLGGDMARLGGVDSLISCCWLAEVADSSSSFHNLIFALALRNAEVDGTSRPSEGRGSTDVALTLLLLCNAVAAVLNPTKVVGTLD